jgi:hypothetical protein
MSAYRWASCVYPKHFLYVEVSPEVIQGVIVVSKSVANPWRDPKIAVLVRHRAIKSWIRPRCG